MATRVVNFPDLGDPVARLRFTVDPNTTPPSVIYVITGLTLDSPQWQACLQEPLKFRDPTPQKTTRKILVRRFTARENLPLNDLKIAFPNAKTIKTDPELMRLKMGDNTQTSAERALASAMSNAALIGMNAVGQRVFQNTMGRFAIDENGNKREEDKMPAALCLRSDGTNDRLCAQGYLMGMMSNVVPEAADVKRFMRIVYGDEAAEDVQRLERMNRLIKAEMTQRLIDHNQFAGAGAYTEAQQLYENSPQHQGVAKGPGALPLPATVMVQEFARAFGFGSTRQQELVYIPKLYDGGLASLLGPDYIVYAEHPAPDSREATMRDLVPQHVNVFEREDGTPIAPHKISILNVENDSDDTFADILATIEARDEQGLTIVIAPSVNVTRSKLLPAEGLVGIEKFAREISDSHEIQGLLQLAPVMRQKMGIDQWLNLLVVGRKFRPAERETRRNNEILQGRLDQVRRRVFDWDTARSAANDVLAAVHEAAGHAWSAADRLAMEKAAAAANENRLQLPYQPFSTNGEAELMIPRNLAGATYEALQNVADRVGSIDEYVRNAIGFTDEQYEFLAPEQVDAMALGISMLDAGEGFLLGDRTGAGKGVTLAGMVSYAWQRGVPVIFLTRQPSLFSDFYRDLKDVGVQDRMRPLLLNYNAEMVDQFSDDLDLIARGVNRDTFRKNYRFGLEGMGNPNLIMTTYSQFSMGEDSEKSDAVIEWSKGAIVIMDESHIAAGDTSNVGTVCRQIAENALGVVYSSATSIKDAEQIGLYKRVLPKTVSVKTVEQAISVGGDAIAETLVNSLARDGRTIRRERNTANVEFRSVRDEKNAARNDKVADQVSYVLAALQRLCGVTEQVGRRLTREQVTKLDRARGIIQTSLDAANLELKRAREELREQRRGQRGGRRVLGEDNVREIRDAVNADIADENNQRLLMDTEPDVDINGGVLQTNFDADGVHREDAAVAAAEAAMFADDPVDAAIAGAPAVDVVPAFTTEDVQLTGPAPEAAVVEHPDVYTAADFGFVTKKEAEQIATDLVDLDNDDAIKRLKARIKKIDSMARRVSTRSAAFGNYLFFSQRVLNVALQSTFAGERAVEQIRNGKKPIIFLEHTFEGALQEAIEADDAIEQEDGTWIIQPPRLKDNLSAMYKTISRMTHTDERGEKYEGSLLDDRFRANPSEKEAFIEDMRVLEDLVAALPDDLYASPIDIIAHTIRKAGFTCAEATGRKYEVREMRDDGSWVVGLRSKASRKISNIERAFNFGEADALVGNKSMSTGMSLHASQSFSDQSQRVTMFVQVFSDPNDYIQAMGRADRRGQVIEPEAEMLSSGLPSEARVMMTHFTKIRKLLAATTSNRDNEFETDEVIDLYNTLGDASVRDYLQANPGTALQLGIPFAHYMPASLKNGREQDHFTPGLAHYVIPRLDLFPPDRARAVFAELAHNFREVQREYDQAGINPLKTNVIDLSKEDVSIISSREDLMPARLNEFGDVTTVFDEAVELMTVSSKRKYRAPTWASILGKIERSILDLRLEAERQKDAGKKPFFTFDRELEALYEANPTAMTPGMRAQRPMPTGLREHVTSVFKLMDTFMRSSDQARALMGETAPAAAPAGGAAAQVGQADAEGVVKVTPDQVFNMRRDWLLTNLAHLVPGSWVRFDVPDAGWETRQKEGVITSLRLPPIGRETNFARWQVTIQVPGHNDEYSLTLRDLYRNNFKPLEKWLPAVDGLSDVSLFRETVPEFFDSYARKTIEWETKRYVMGGNMFRAAAVAADAKIGASGIVQLKNQPPMRVITCDHRLNRREIFEKVPIDLDAQTMMGLFVNIWGYVDRPHGANAAYVLAMLGGPADGRGMHITSKAHASGLSMYWIASKKGVKDRWSTQSREEDEEDQVTAETDAVDQQDAHALAGFAVRYRGLNDAQMAEARAMVETINAQLPAGASKATFETKANTTAARVVVRFRTDGGQRESDEVISEKMRLLISMATAKYQHARFFPASMTMRLLCMAASEKQYADAREARTAREEALRLAKAASRIHIASDSMDAEIDPTAALDAAAEAESHDDVAADRLAA